MIAESGLMASVTSALIAPPPAVPGGHGLQDSPRGSAAEGDADATIAQAIAQAYCSDAAVRAAEEALQLHGGIGMTWEHPMHTRLKRVVALKMILAGSHAGPREREDLVAHARARQGHRRRAELLDVLDLADAGGDQATTRRRGASCSTTARTFMGPTSTRFRFAS